MNKLSDSGAEDCLFQLSADASHTQCGVGRRSSLRGIAGLGGGLIGSALLLAITLSPNDQTDSNLVADRSSSTPESHDGVSVDPDPTGYQTPSAREQELARLLADKSVAADNAVIHRVTAATAMGNVALSNTGTECHSGRLLIVVMYGEFPNSDISGILPQEGLDQRRLVAKRVYADPGSGAPCLVSALDQTAPPTPNAVDLEGFK